MKPNFDSVQFGSDQLAYLENLFPENVFHHTNTEAQMRHYHGQQAVVKAVRERTRGHNVRIVTVRGDIPSPG